MFLPATRAAVGTTAKIRATATITALVLVTVVPASGNVVPVAVAGVLDPSSLLQQQPV